MSDSLIFPYGIALRDGAAVNLFPAAEVQIADTNGDLFSFFFVIDSGASISALPQSDASILGIDFKNGRPAEVTGIGREIVNGWRHEISVRLGQKNILLPVIFLDDEAAPRVLGRAGIFDRFTVVFEENRRRSAILSKNSKEAESVKTILDSI